MTRQERVLAVILARGGSKGLPGKNIMELHGKPLIAWSIDAGLKAVAVDDVIVSTDSLEIAAVARELGAEVPFIRPTLLAADVSTSIDALLHALNALAAEGRTYEYVMLLEPTSPLRDATDIDNALEALMNQDADAIVSICRSEAIHPAFMFSWGERGRLVPYLTTQPKDLRRQDVEELFFLEGSIYASKVGVLREKLSFYHEGTVGFVVPKWKSPEIDDELDFLLVEAIMRQRGIAG
ncbi:MAG: CMP-N,N'-diacetyllegionaminic acid synthase [Nitrospira sp.]|nr:CMP-N,N'-diacetyllegionaminic acid synthase [Nitrospira sp.]